LLEIRCLDGQFTFLYRVSEQLHLNLMVGLTKHFVLKVFVAFFDCRYFLNKRGTSQTEKVSKEHQKIKIILSSKDSHKFYCFTKQEVIFNVKDFFLNIFNFWLSDFPTKNKTHCVPTFRSILSLSDVSSRFQGYHPCLHVAHRNTHVNGANFVINHHETHVNTLKS